jgi:hypothetical protein
MSAFLLSDPLEQYIGSMIAGKVAFRAPRDLLMQAAGERGHAAISASYVQLV